MDYVIRPYKENEEKYVADAQRRIYSKEYNWGSSFIDYAVEVALNFPKREKNEKEDLWVAESQGKLIGCIMLCQTEELATGQLRLFLVEKEYRGMGIGKALTETLINKARMVGYRKLILWTASPLHDAICQYEKIGFKAVEKNENKNWRLDGELLYEIKMVMDL